MTLEGASLLTPVQLFLLLFPVDYIKNVIIKNLNEKHELETSFGEFLVYLGLRFLFATWQKCDLKDYWSKETPSM